MHLCVCGMGTDLRVWCLLGRCCAIWAPPLVSLLQLFFRYGLVLLPGAAWTTVLLPYTSWVAELTSVPHHSQLSPHLFSYSVYKTGNTHERLLQQVKYNSGLQEKHLCIHLSCELNFLLGPPVTDKLWCFRFVQQADVFSNTSLSSQGK
jgi:hypothetical protein